MLQRNTNSKENRVKKYVGIKKKTLRGLDEGDIEYICGE